MLIVIKDSLMQEPLKLQIVNHVEVIVWYAQMVTLVLRVMMVMK